MRRKDHLARPSADGHAPRYFAATMPGLGRLLADELGGHLKLRPDVRLGNDGRADLVLFQPRHGALPRNLQLRLAEDLFVVIGQAEGASSLHRLARALINPNGLEQALSVWASRVRPLRGVMGFHVVARVLSERRFRRIEFRSEITTAVERLRPRWRQEDPAELELWALEQRPDSFVAGIRLSDRAMRQHGDGRKVERHGALRPVVAAAMVKLAGVPTEGVLLDPFCGSGTILGEASGSGWAVVGMDLDTEALRVARANLPDVALCQADARRLPLEPASVDALVANLPFGRQFTMDGTRSTWLANVLTEAERVTRPGGRVVLLVPPPLPARIRPTSLRLVRRVPIRLLGTPTTVWGFQRIGERSASAAHNRREGPRRESSTARAGRRR
jgi:23S rRNA G2445 N2-methylase RlmL